MWALTPRATRAPHPPTEDTDHLLDFEDIDYLGQTQPEAMDRVIAWLEKLVSIIWRLTSDMHVSFCSFFAEDQAGM